MERVTFIETDGEGVHVLQLDCMDVGTLCGIGCNNPDLKPTRKIVVTCKRCIYILRVLSKIKYKENISNGKQ
jgi:hypothetical protein